MLRITYTIDVNRFDDSETTFAKGITENPHETVAELVALKTAVMIASNTFGVTAEFRKLMTIWERRCDARINGN